MSSRVSFGEIAVVNLPSDIQSVVGYRGFVLYEQPYVPFPGSGPGCEA